MDLAYLYPHFLEAEELEIVDESIQADPNVKLEEEEGTGARSRARGWIRTICCSCFHLAIRPPPIVLR